jgi:hypothetical protein
VPFTILPAQPAISLTAADDAVLVMPTVTGVSGGTPDTNPVTYSYIGTTSANVPYGPTATPPTETGSYVVTGTVAAGGDYLSAVSGPVAVAITRSTPVLDVNDNGGIYTGNSFPATVTVTGSNGVAGPSLEGVEPTLTYFAGATAGGIQLPGAPTTVGTYFVFASFAGSAHYSGTNTGTSFVIGQAMPTLTLRAPSGVYNGTPFVATATIAGAGGVAGSSLENVAPTLNYYRGLNPSGNPLPGPPTEAGGYTALVSFAGSTDYQAVQMSVLFTIAQATPVISWASPADIAAGTPLGGTQLDATTTVAGNFAYSPPPGTVLPSGQGQVLSVTFTPTDPADYTSATGSTTINVTQPPSPPSPPHMAALSATTTKKGVTALAITFDEALSSSSADSLGQYQVAGGVTKVAKKHKQTVFSKPLAIKSITLNSAGTVVTITLTKPYKGVVQVTALAGLRAVNGASSTSATSMNVS